jgi:tetratricopeptide (TPR) repeat protein
VATGGVKMPSTPDPLSTLSRPGERPGPHPVTAEPKPRPKTPAKDSPADVNERLTEENVTAYMMDGSVRAVQQLSQKWGELPEKERAEALGRIKANMKPEYREMIHTYFRNIAVDGKENEEERVRLLTTLEAGVARDQSGVKTDKAIKKLAEGWEAMPEEDRKEALHLLGAIKEQEKRVETRQKLHVKAAIGVEDLKKEVQKLGDLEKKLQTLTATSTAEEKKGPAVWHRDRQRPTVARVYIGDGNSLDLMSLNVSVTIDGPRARTVVDHIFRNPHNQRLEGTFEYPLPTGASASYFAMFPGKTADQMPALFARGGKPAAINGAALARLTPAEVVRQVATDDWGNPQEARIVNKQRALETYEDIVRGQIDPGLLEYAGGNTFSGRVFPIPQKGFTRVIFAYEELLPWTKSGVQYRFPLPARKIDDMKVTLSAKAAECRNATFKPEGAEVGEGAGRVNFTRTWKDEAALGDVLFGFTPPRADVQTLSGRQGDNGPHYLYARVRPELPVEATKPFADSAVFLLDTSLSEFSDRFDVSMKLLKKILESDTSIKRFNVLTFDVGARWLEPKGRWLPNTDKGRSEVAKRLDGIVLEGATNVSAALDKIVALDGKEPLNVFLLSDGQVTWGESEVPALVSRFESRCQSPVRFHCYRTGLGADNLELFEGLTRRGGGIFQCYGEADLAAAAVAHRHHCFQVDRVSILGTENGDLLVGGRRSAIYPGGELVVAARAPESGKAQLVLEGTYQGKPLTRKYPVEFRDAGELAPRGWAEVAVASLLSLNDSKLDSLITAYCQQFGIGSKVASFLILENANDYKRLNLEEERGRTVPGGDLGVFLAESWKKAGASLGARADLARFLERIEPRVGLNRSPEAEHVKKLLALLSDKDIELADEDLDGSLVKIDGVTPEYWTARKQNRRDVSAYLAEAKRRAGSDDPAGAVRALSSIIEEYPSRSDALRLVGYRLLDLKQASAAARLFRRVQDSRPFEPHSYRDLARSLEDCGKFGLAAVQYEIVLAGTWHNRFHQSLKEVTLEEYVRMMRQAIAQNAVSAKLADQFGERLERLVSVKTRSDLRVTISWNTDATDVDLWVVEPDGEKCFYQHNRTKNGGALSQDQTQGYGPERYHIEKAQPGVYTIYVHYFAVNQNLLGGETHVNVIVTEHAGTPQERSKRHTVILKKHGEQVEVCRVKF